MFSSIVNFVFNYFVESLCVTLVLWHVLIYLGCVCLSKFEKTFLQMFADT